METSTKERRICELEFVQRETGHRVCASIGVPVQNVSGAWECQTEITDLDKGGPIAVMGSDPFQTLVQAMERFRQVLAREVPEYESVSGPSYVVFPRHIPTGYGFDVYRKLCSVVDQEVEGIEAELNRHRLEFDKRGGL